MVTKKPTPQTPKGAPASLQDAGYQFAKTGETSRELAKFVLSVCPGFLDDVPAEIKTELYAGFQLMKHELEGDKFYRIGDTGTYVPLTAEQAAKAGDTLRMNINVAMSYSTQEFGKLKESDPGRHAIIGPLRKAFSTYASNNMSALRTTIRALTSDGNPRKRSANKGFREAMTAVFEAYDKRARTAKDRGDTDADPVRYRVARDAFWKAYDAK